MTPRSLLAAILPLALLASCSASPPVTRTGSSSSKPVLAASSSSAGPEGDTLENADVAGAPAPKEPVNAADPYAGIPERLLPTGILEIGKADAPVVLLAFTHHSCKYCARFASEDMPRLTADFIATGKVRYDVALLPLRKYPESAAQASALYCAATQGKGFAMHRALFTEDADIASLQTVIKNLGLDAEAFRDCLTAADAKSAFTRQDSMSKSLDVTLVPTLILNGEKLVGLYPYPDLRGKVEEVLKTR